MMAFVSEHGAIDAFLSAVVNELSPNKERVCCLGSQDNLFSGADKLLSLTPIGVVIAAVMPLVECEAVKVAILCQPPQRAHFGVLSMLLLPVSQRQIR